MILDSNIIIYSSLSQYENLGEFIRKKSPAVSAISRVEVLGFRDIENDDLAYFETFFAAAAIIPVSASVTMAR